MNPEVPCRPGCWECTAEEGHYWQLIHYMQKVALGTHKVTEKEHDRDRLRSHP
jgi:hypothetical protein